MGLPAFLTSGMCHHGESLIVLEFVKASVLLRRVFEQRFLDVCLGTTCALLCQWLHFVWFKVVYWPGCGTLSISALKKQKTWQHGRHQNEEIKTEVLPVHINESWNSIYKVPNMLTFYFKTVDDDLWLPMVKYFTPWVSAFTPGVHLEIKEL